MTLSTVTLGYFEQLEQTINHFLAEKKYQQAYKLCNEILTKFPEQKRFLKVKNNIEYAVAEENERIVDQRLKEMDQLWKTENYSEIIKQIKDLLLIAPNNKKLVKLYHQAQVSYAEKIEKLKADFQKKQIARLEQLLTNNPDELMDELFALERSNPGNLEIKSLADTYRDKLIAKKIKEKEDLIYSDKYLAIDNFIQQLKKIDDKNKQITQLMVLVDNRKRKNQIEEQAEFVYQGLQHLDTLMKLKKFDKVVQAASEILAIDKDNKQIKRILNKAQKKLFNQTRDLSIDTITKNQASLKQEYFQNKNSFIKL